MSTPYQILGIPTTASAAEITEAYRKACMKHHPDRGGDVTEFQRVQAAYEALKTRVCPLCNNKGTVTTRQGAFVNKTKCPRCWSKR